MPRPIIQIGDEAREMTESEFAQWQIDVQAAAEAQEAADARVAALASAQAKLAALGLTDAEVSALIGV